MKKFIIGIGITLVMAAIDFAVITSFIIRSNAASEIESMLSAFALCMGLEGGPFFLGNGIASLLDRTLPKDGFGRKRPIISLSGGAILTTLAFSIYLIVRILALRESAAIVNEDLEQVYDLSTSLLPIFTPIVTSIVAFLASWITSLDGIHAHQSQERRLKKKYDKLKEEQTKLEGKLISELQHEWNTAPGLQNIVMPQDTSSAIATIKKAHADTHYRDMLGKLKALLVAANVIDPFLQALQQRLSGHVQNEITLQNIKLETIPEPQIKARIAQLTQTIENQPQEIVDTLNP